MPGQVNILSGSASVILSGATGGPLNLSNGSTSLPAYSFSSDARDGMWRDTAVGGMVLNYIVPTMIFGDGKVVMKSSDYFGWNADDNLISSYNPDVLLTRNAAATLRLGNVDTGSPVAYKLQSGGSRAGTDSNVGGAALTIQSGLGTGTGTASSLIFQTPTLAGAGSGAQSYATRLTILGNADAIAFGASADVGLRRIGAGILGLDTGTAAAGATLEMYEQTAPAAPAANGCRLYCQDNGGGKTQLMAIFASGAAQQLAIQP